MAGKISELDPAVSINDADEVELKQSTSNLRLAWSLIKSTLQTAFTTVFAPVGSKYIVQTSDGTLTNEQALGALSTGILKNTTTTGVLSIAAAATDYVAPGAVTTNGITMSTARLLGRSTASTGAVEEITLGTNLSFTGTTLNAAGGGGGADFLTVQVFS